MNKLFELNDFIMPKYCFIADDKMAHLFSLTICATSFAFISGKQVKMNIKHEKSTGRTGNYEKYHDSG